jgi:hypothetical protein
VAPMSSTAAASAALVMMVVMAILPMSVWTAAG